LSPRAKRRRPKVAILILEFFDRHGITIRRGDVRRTVPHKLEQFGPVPAKEVAEANG